MKTLSFDIFRHPAVSRVRVDLLLLDGEVAGRIITAYPSDGAGRVRSMIGVYSGPLAIGHVMRGQAGGYGYCKTSAAINDALDRAGVEHADLSGRGMGAVRTWFESKGYAFVEAL